MPIHGISFPSNCSCIGAPIHQQQRVDAVSQNELTSQINDAIGAHGMWKMRLRTAIKTNRADISSHDAGCDDRCAFGQWLHGPTIDQKVRTGVPFGVVKRLHQDFHRSAGSVLRSVEQGNVAAAEVTLSGEFNERSEKLVRALTKWKREVGAY